MAKEKLTKKLVVAALLATGGQKAAAARWIEKHAKISCSRETVGNYVNRYPEISELVQEQIETVTDFAVLGLMEHVQNRSLKAITYWLNNKGQDRGFGRSGASAAARFTSPSGDLEIDFTLPGNGRD